MDDVHSLTGISTQNAKATPQANRFLIQMAIWGVQIAFWKVVRRLHTLTMLESNS